MDKEIQIQTYEITDHKITGVRLIDLKGQDDSVILKMPMEMLAVSSFFRCIVKQPIFLISTHKMFLKILNNLEGKMQKIVIDDLEKGLFYATIYFTDHNDKEFTVKADASDAIVMSLRAPCPAFALSSVIDAAKFDEDNRVCWYNANDKESLEIIRDFSDNDLASLPHVELEQLLKIAAEIEDYKLAARLKTALNKIESEQQII